MRTSVTLEDDVAARLKRVMRDHQLTLKAAINAALRAGLDTLDAPRSPTEPYRVRPFHLGRSLVGSLDNVAEVLSRAEGPD